MVGRCHWFITVTVKNVLPHCTFRIVKFLHNFVDYFFILIHNMRACTWICTYRISSFRIKYSWKYTHQSQPCHQRCYSLSFFSQKVIKDFSPQSWLQWWPTGWRSKLPFQWALHGIRVLYSETISHRPKFIFYWRKKDMNILYDIGLRKIYRFSFILEMN